MIEYIIENKEWIFSGIGVLIITAIWGLFYKRKNKNENVSKISGNHNVVSQQNIDSDANSSEVDGDFNKVDQK